MNEYLHSDNALNLEKINHPSLFILLMKLFVSDTK